MIKINEVNWCSSDEIKFSSQFRVNLCAENANSENVNKGEGISPPVNVQKCSDLQPQNTRKEDYFGFFSPPSSEPRPARVERFQTASEGTHTRAAEIYLPICIYIAAAAVGAVRSEQQLKLGKNI